MLSRARFLAFVPIALTAGLALSSFSGSADAQVLRGHNTSAPVDFAADHIEIQDRSDRVIVSGHVEVRQGGMRLTAQRLTVAYHDTDGLTIDRLDASGGVVITRGNERASGDVAIYDLNRKLITLIGKVQLNQGANRLGGARLVIDLVSGRATVDGQGAPAGVSQTSSGRVSGRFQVNQSGANSNVADDAPDGESPKADTPE